MTSKKYKLDRHSWYLTSRIYREYMRPYFWIFALAIFGMTIAAAALAAIAYISKDLVQALNSRNFNFLVELGFTFFLLFVFRGIGSLVQHQAINWSGERVITDMQKKLYRHFVYADLTYFHTNSTGALISRLTHDLNRMRYAVTDSLTGLGVHLFTIVGLVGIMIYSDLVLAGIIFVLLPLSVFPIVLIGRRMRRLSGSRQIEAGRLTSFLDETFRGVRHVKAYGMEENEIERASSLMEGIFKLTIQGFRTQSVSYPMVDVLGGCAIFAVMLYGADQVIGGAKNPGDFASFIVALMLSYHPIKQLALLNARVQEGLAAADRVFRALDMSATVVDKVNALDVGVAEGRVGFENVRFEYRAGVPALDGITFEVPAGKTVALVGPSGAGKSTIMNLIPRFYDVNEGAVTIDGVDIRKMTLSSLRANIGLVSQEISLFDDTVRANIAYGKKDATDREIIEAAKRAAAHNFIVELPEGYETIVGGQGIRLSGGERQRIAIARAMLKSAPILLLDEATSALDTKSERQVQAALKALMKGRTTFVIAHRLSTVFDADMIYVIEAGKLVESGAHKALINGGGLYAKLHAMQLVRGEAKDLEVAARATG